MSTTTQLAPIPNSAHTKERERLYVVISGEHPTLPRSEVRAILHAYKVDYRVLNEYYKLIELEAPVSAMELIVGRAGYVDEAGMELDHTEGSVPEIERMIRGIKIDDYLSRDDSLSLRVARYGEKSLTDETSRVALEARLGGLIASLSGCKIDLEHPTKRFRGVLAGDTFHLGLIGYQRPKGIVHRRRPRKRAVFHPSTMPPKLARCLVNLSQAREGGVFLDPFCGIGGILVEAGLLGCEMIGMDALRKMVRGTRGNLRHFGLNPLGLLVGDARSVPLTHVDAIATDPPYGSGASTLRSTTAEILRDFLPVAHEILRSQARMVVVSPVGTEAQTIALESGFRVVDSHLMYVHRSLTREILVLEVN